MVEAKFAISDGFAIATLNLDHITKMNASETFAAAYAKHDLIVADGRPISWLSKIAGHPVETAPGSELILPICKLAEKHAIKVAIVGTTDSALSAAAKSLKSRFPKLQIEPLISPTRGFDPNGAEASEIIEKLKASHAGMCFLALGAPKQELFAANAIDQLPGTGFAAIGAGINFIAGYQKRAPKFVRMIALEWLWRILQDPKRMLPRYLRCFAVLPRLTLNAIKLRFSRQS